LKNITKKKPDYSTWIDWKPPGFKWAWVAHETGIRRLDGGS